MGVHEARIEKCTRQHGQDQMKSARDPTPRITDPVRYKTTLCKNFVQYGTCPYDFKCQFAHGKSELRKIGIEKSANAKKEQKENKVRNISQNWRAESRDNQPVCTPVVSPVSSRASSPFEAGMTADSRRNNNHSKTPPGLLKMPPGLGACNIHPEPLKRLELPPAPEGLDEPLEVCEPCIDDDASKPLPTARVGFVSIDYTVGDDFAKCGSVPESVRALWGNVDAPAESRLRCNATTGKVEYLAPTKSDANEPWLQRRISSASLLVRRAVSFVLSEESSARITSSA